VLENGDSEIKLIRCKVYYLANSSSTTSSLKITMDDLFGDDKTAIKDKTTAVPFPTKDLIAKIDEAIEEHIANTIET